MRVLCNGKTLGFQPKDRSSILLTRSRFLKGDALIHPCGSTVSPQHTHDTQEKLMSNKNPFEIRAEMLQMAKDYMDNQWHMNLEFTRKLFDDGRKSVEEVQTALTPYSVDDMMTKAKEFYQFVSDKK